MLGYQLCQLPRICLVTLKQTIMFDMLEKLNAHMNIKIHFLFSHLDRFPENFEAVSNEQRERLHQDIQ